MYALLEAHFNIKRCVFICIVIGGLGLYVFTLLEDDNVILHDNKISTYCTADENNTTLLYRLKCMMYRHNNNTTSSSNSNRLPVPSTNYSLPPTQLNTTTRATTVEVVKVTTTTALPERVLFPDRVNKTLTILFGTSYFLHKKWDHFNPELDACPDMKKLCEYTYDQRRYEDADVILYHMRDLWQDNRARLPFQKRVFSNQESQLNINIDTEKYKHYFNLTMTYQSNASIHWPYGICNKVDDHPVLNASTTPINYNANKKNVVAWFVQNCYTTSHRQEYTAELSKYIEVHKYGCNGKYSCLKSKANYCDKVMLNNNYRFYLSFENSFCTDYITEKLFRILELNVIPIVSGLADYRHLLPPHSYIDVLDYESPKQLGAYLMKLSTDDRLYNEYHAWKTTGAWKCRIYLGDDIGCRLCRYALHNRQSIQVADIHKFWNKRSNCKTWNEFYKGHI